MTPEEEINSSTEPDAPFRFAIDPLITERHARTIIDIMAGFAGGTTCEELRRQFEQITGRRRQTFYDTWKYVKYKDWVIGGGGHSKLYQLNPNGCWKPPSPTSAGEMLEKDRLEHLVDTQSQQVEELQDKVERLLAWSDSSSDTNGANVALSSLMKIVGDGSASTRQRIKAAAAVLGYKAQADVSEFVRKYLQTVCESTDIAVDYRIEAGELLRRHEAPRVTPDSVRPSYRTDTAELEEPVEPLADLVARRRARQEAYERELALRPAEDALPSDVCSALNATYSRHGK